MYKITANDWDGLGYNKIKGAYRKTRHTNTKMLEVAERYASKSRSNPSPLEKAMIEFLNSHQIKYEFQKPYCIYTDGVITQFFIVDFYIPTNKVVIETDGSYHNNQREYDDYRTKLIEEQYPGVKIVRWGFKDFRSYRNMKKLLQVLKEKR